MYSMLKIEMTTFRNSHFISTIMNWQKDLMNKKSNLFKSKNVLKNNYTNIYDLCVLKIIGYLSMIFLK